jgi:hypothetical protein
MWLAVQSEKHDNVLLNYAQIRSVVASLQECERNVLKGNFNEYKYSRMF